MKNIFFSIITCVFSIFTFAETEYYEGKIANSKIYLSFEIDDEDNTFLGKYFYEKSLKNIKLEGIKNKNQITLIFNSEIIDGKFDEKFTLTKIKTGYKGFWLHKSGKKLAVSLTKIDFSKYNTNSNFELNDELDKVKLQFLELKEDSISEYKDINIHWISEKHCVAPFFRISSKIKKYHELNRYLEKEQLQMIIAQLGCSSSFTYSNGEGIEFSTEISYLETNLMGFTIHKSWFCGGAHPDFGSTGYLIDLNTVEFYELDDIIAFDKSVTKYKEDNFDAYSEYRATYFAPKIYELINEKEHFVKTNDEDDTCDYTDLSNWQFVEWKYTEKGIEITPYFYRAARSCQTPFLIEFDKLTKYKHPNFRYNFK